MNDNRFMVLDSHIQIIVDDNCSRYEVIYYFSESSQFASVEYFNFGENAAYTRREALKAAMEYALIFI